MTTELRDTKISDVFNVNYGIKAGTSYWKVSVEDIN
jgi:hypothetical protein